MGVTEFDDVEFAPVPTLFTAATLNVYLVLFFRPEIVADVVLPTSTGLPAIDGLTVTL